MFAQIFVIGATVIALARAGLLGHRDGGYGQYGPSQKYLGFNGHNFNGVPVMAYSHGYVGSVAHTGPLSIANPLAYDGSFTHSNRANVGPYAHAGPLLYTGPIHSASLFAHANPLTHRDSFAHSNLLRQSAPLSLGALSYSGYSQTSALNHPQGPAYSSPLSHASSNARAISHVDRTDVIQSTRSAGQLYTGTGQLAHATSIAQSAPLASAFNLVNSAPYNAPLLNTGSLAHATHHAYSAPIANLRPVAQATPLGYATPLSHQSPLTHGTPLSHSILNADGPMAHAATIGNGLGRYEYARQYSGAENYFSHPKYQYSYSVEDPKTGDHKAQQESRDGDVVKGEYSLLQPDGSFRKVSYSADDHHGFNAVVQNSGPSHHVYSSQRHH